MSHHAPPHIFAQRHATPANAPHGGRCAARSHPTHTPSQTHWRRHRGRGSLPLIQRASRRDVGPCCHPAQWRRRDRTCPHATHGVPWWASARAPRLAVPPQSARHRRSPGQAAQRHPPCSQVQAVAVAAAGVQPWQARPAPLVEGVRRGQQAAVALVGGRAPCESLPCYATGAR